MLPPCSSVVTVVPVASLNFSSVVSCLSVPSSIFPSFFCNCFFLSAYKWKYISTVITLSIETDRPLQTV